MEREVLAGVGGGFAVPGAGVHRGKDAVTLARDILALDQDAFSAAFRKSPMKRAKLAGLQRNAAVAFGSVATARDTTRLRGSTNSDEPLV